VPWCKRSDAVARHGRSREARARQVAARLLYAGALAAATAAVIAAVALGAAAQPAAGEPSSDAGWARSAALYNLAGAPDAAFVWFPAHPHTGERVLLASTSTDLISPIVGFAWDLSETGAAAAFVPGPPVLNTSFSTPADHVVRLRVTAGNGASGVASRTIEMSEPPASVLLPFPIVRIAGRVFGKAMQVKVLAVRAPRGSRIVVRCKGRSCPAKAAARSVPALAHGARWVSFPRFQRLLRAPTTLEVRVSNGTKIGSFTSFKIRRRKLPFRVDSCLDPRGVTPIACPSS
jgi:hypothetical protein